MIDGFAERHHQTCLAVSKPSILGGCHRRPSRWP